MKTPLRRKIWLILIYNRREKNHQTLALLVPQSQWLFPPGCHIWVLHLSQLLWALMVYKYGTCTKRWGCPLFLSHFEWVRMAAHRVWDRASGCQVARNHHCPCQALMVCSQPACKQERRWQRKCVQMGSLYRRRGTRYTCSTGARQECNC